jgi:3-hydroxybutyryl-CoA dehydrogenase
VNVAVLGAGTMGHGIAYAAAAAGFDVALADPSSEALDKGMAQVAGLFDGGVARGKLTAEERDAGLARVRRVPELSAAVEAAAIVVEAAPERLELKRAIFAELERHAPADALLGTNTSALPVSRIAEAVASPERVVGLHFFNPVPAMRLLEVVRGERTSDETVRRARAFAEALGKTAIVVKDLPGFATSRLGVVLGLEAARMVEQGVASAADIDRAMELGYNHPMGPLRLGDLVGLDVRLAIADHLHAAYGDDTYRAPELLRRMVAEGKLGRKTGEGFYRWNDA